MKGDWQQMLRKVIGCGHKGFPSGSVVVSLSLKGANEGRQEAIFKVQVPLGEQSHQDSAGGIVDTLLRTGDHSEGLNMDWETDLIFMELDVCIKRHLLV